MSGDYQRPLFVDTALKSVLPAELAPRVAAPLEAAQLTTAEDLYECIASVGGNWYRNFPGISREDAVAVVDWLAGHAADVGEVPERFYPAGYNTQTRRFEAVAAPGTEVFVPVPLESIRLTEMLSGAAGTNRAQGPAAFDATNDLAALHVWLDARANNPNTYSQYRKEAERFILWCTMERQKALSSIDASDAAQYPRWIESLGRTAEKAWAQKWRIAQSAWIGPKNAPRLSPAWRPFNGPLTASSRKTALTVIRLFFSFLLKTGYLRYNPFDQVSPKIRLLPGEGAIREFADRSLTASQWALVLRYLESLEDGPVKIRLRLILMLGKGLGMRASEMVQARVGWINQRRIGDTDRLMMEIVGKGDKVRRLPLSAAAMRTVEEYLATRGLPVHALCPPETPLLSNRRKASSGPDETLTRSGLYLILCDFFSRAALLAQQTSAGDAAKLRASSTHWLRHTFATAALKHMPLNVVQNAMGHASINTTSLYLTPEESQIAQAMDQMNEL